MSCTADIQANIGKLKDNIRKCAGMGARLVVLQELHNTVYFCQSENASLCDLAETVPGPSTETFGALAKELGVVLVLSLFERRLAFAPSFNSSTTKAICTPSMALAKSTSPSASSFVVPVWA